MVRDKKILIVGGGIAGPALGIKLIEQGAQVKVIETRKELELDEGLFMGISPNGLKILEGLNDINRIYDDFAPGKLHFLNAGGKKIAELDTDYQSTKYGIRSVQLRRPSIVKLLHDKLNALGNPVEYDCKLNSIYLTDHKIHVEASNGLSDDFDLLIAADGIHSKCRRLLFPEFPKPFYSKLVSTGSIVEIPDWEDNSNALNLTFGKRAFFGYATSNKGQVWWFNNFYRETEPERDTLSRGSYRIKDQLLELHRDEHKRISEIISGTDRFFAYPIYDMQPLKKWHGKGFCLIGDAAHAIPPHTGQGASLALEDAAVLAKCLEKYPDAELAFSEFQKIRKPRVQKILAQARRVGLSKTKANPIALFFRDVFMAKFIHLEKRKMDWVYAYDISKLKI